MTSFDLNDLKRLDKLMHNSFTPRSYAICEFNWLSLRPKFFNELGM